MPKRVQLRRTKGWRMPVGAVKVDRSSPWGNSYRVGGDHYFAGKLHIKIDAATAVEMFRAREVRSIRNLVSLRGKDLACWCRLCPAHAEGKPFGVECQDCAPCHADVIGEVVNQPIAAVPE